MLGFLAYRTGDRVLAEDLLAETFERVLRARHRYDRRRGSETTWIYAIARNCLRDHARRRSAEQRALALMAAGETATATDMAGEVANRDAIHWALDCLSEEER